MIRLRGVHKRYGGSATEVHAVRGVDLDVEAGELVAVSGPSGSGKSTLLLLAGGLEAPDCGTVEVLGTDLGVLPDGALHRYRRKHIGFVFQNFNLMRTLTVEENVMLPAELDGVPRRSARADARAALAEVGLAGLETRMPAQLSGGQQQRVAIARALGRPGRVLFADEPTGALDTASADLVMSILLQRIAAGAAGLLVTHEPDIARYADRQLFMRDGLIIADAIR